MDFEIAPSDYGGGVVQYNLVMIRNWVRIVDHFDFAYLKLRGGWVIIFCIDHLFMKNHWGGKMYFHFLLYYSVEYTQDNKHIHNKHIHNEKSRLSVVTTCPQRTCIVFIWCFWSLLYGICFYFGSNNICCIIILYRYIQYIFT